MTEFGLTLPETLPLNSEIQYAFDASFGYAEIGAMDVPELRRDHMDESLIEKLPDVARNLQAVITRSYGNNTSLSSGRGTLRESGSENVDSIYEIHGLDLDEDFIPHIIPQLVEARNQLNDTFSSPGEVLERLSVLVGVVFAESQVFPDGNHRIARALHDYIRDGREALSSERVYDAQRTFSAPEDIERIILEQNTSRLINRSRKPGTFEMTGGVYVGKELTLKIDENKQYLKELFDRINQKYEYDFPIAFSGSLKKGLEREYDYLIADEDYHVKDALNALRSKEYAAAAWTVAFKGHTPTWPIGAVNLEKFYQADRALHVMRIMSLMESIMEGGTIIEVKDAENGFGREINRKMWWPAAPMK